MVDERLSGVSASLWRPLRGRVGPRNETDVPRSLNRARLQLCGSAGMFHTLAVLALGTGPMHTSAHFQMPELSGRTRTRLPFTARKQAEHGRDAHATSEHGRDAHATSEHGRDARATAEKRIW